MRTAEDKGITAKIPHNNFLKNQYNTCFSKIQEIKEKLERWNLKKKKKIKNLLYF